MRARRMGIRLTIFLLILAALSACTQKAESLKVAAAQFEATSIQAIEAVVDLNRKRIAAPEIGDVEQLDYLVDGLQDAVDKRLIETLDFGALGVLQNPLAVEPGPEDLAMAAFLAKMRRDYGAFARIFERLDEGSFLAASKVKEALPFAQKLTVQLVSITKCVERRPLHFIVLEAALVQDVKDTLKAWEAAGIDVTDRRAQVEAWRRRMRGIEDEKSAAKEAALQLLAQSASLGFDIAVQLQNYDKLTVSDIAEALSFGVAFAQNLSGRDLASIQGRIDEIAAVIKSDAAWKTSVELALEAINDSGAMGGKLDSLTVESPCTT